MENLDKIISSKVCDPLTSEREKELAEQLRIALDEGDEVSLNKIREEIIMRHLRLILFIGKGYQHSLDREDIISVGALALTQAANNWNPDKGLIYGWAERWITTALTRASDASRSIRIPQNVAYQAGLVQKKINQIENELGRDLTQKEKDEIAGGTQTFENLPAVKDSLDRPILTANDNGYRTFGDTIQDDDSNPETIAELADTVSGIRSALDELTDMERKIIKCRFGIDNEHRLTLAQLGEKYEVSGEAMRRIEATALSKLRHPAIKNPLEGL